MHPLDAWRAERRLRRVAVEHQVDAAELLPKIVERTGHHRAAAIDDGDVIGDLVHLGDLMRGEEHGHLPVGHMGHERLENLLGHDRVESRGRLVEDEQLRAPAQRQQQRELRAHAARERLNLPVERQFELAEVALLEVAAPPREQGRREADHPLDRHVVVEILVVADKPGAAPDGHARFVRIGRQAEDAGVPAGGPRHAEQDLDGGGLAGAVPSEKPVDGSGGHLQAQTAEGLHAAVVLPQVGRFDDERVSHEDLLCWSTLPAPLRTAAGSPRR